jgi:tRNA G18 (ribose-2'-O)-methylase SpoU
MPGDLDLTHPRLDPYRHVGDPAWLRHAGLFVAEGRLVVSRLIATQRYLIHSILVTPAARAALAAPLASHEADVMVGSPAAIEQITGFDFHRGCLALAHRPSPDRDDGWMDGDQHQDVLVLDGIADPDNVGGLFRTAASLGAGGILVTAACADPLYRKAVRTSMGAVLELPWATVASARDASERLRRIGYTIAALTPRPHATPIERFAALGHPRVALVLGSEGEGLSDAVLAGSDHQVRIPQVPGVDSLNVTVAAGIALHALRAARLH